MVIVCEKILKLCKLGYLKYIYLDNFKIVFWKLLLKYENLI